VHKSSKKLLEQSQKLEKLWSHIFTGTIGLTSGSDAWYRKLRELLETQQSQPVWISETKVRSPGRAFWCMIYFDLTRFFIFGDVALLIFCPGPTLGVSFLSLSLTLWLSSTLFRCHW